LSSSPGIGEEKSTFTRCIGPIMRPSLVLTEQRANRTTDVEQGSTDATSLFQSRASLLRVVDEGLAASLGKILARARCRWAVDLGPRICGILYT